MGKNFDKFILLMWKNFLLQWRHPIQTLVEILAPVIFTALLVIIRSLVEPVDHSASFYVPFQTTVSNLTIFNRTLAWSPNNTALIKAMDETVQVLNKKTKVTNRFTHRGFNDSHDLDKFLSTEISAVSIMAGIKFDDSLWNLTELLPNLNVTFRFPGELRGKNNFTKFNFGTWKSNRLYPSYQVSGPRDVELNEGGMPSYYQEGFLMLQEELSFSIINEFKQQLNMSRFDRQDVPIYMQRFSYPKYTEDLLLTALQAVVGLIFMVSFVYTCISTVKVIVQEKELQLKEAMKIMGLPNWLHWTAWFLKSFIFLIMTIIVMVILLKAPWYPGSKYTVFTHTNPLVLFVFLLLYVCATITFCFAISAFFSKANLAATIAGLAWFLSYFPYAFWSDRYGSLSLTQKLTTSICPNTAMAYGFQLTIMFEGIEEGLQWYNIWKTATPDDNLTLGHLLLVLFIDTLLYMLIALYVEAVYPGDFGIPLPWYFPFSYSYWCGKPMFAGTDAESCTESESYEKEPVHLDAGIKIRKLRKAFSKNNIAVRDLTLNMYKDQITVLLGHNGAGKTTTMSMLTGMLPPTSGTAVVGGYDIRTDMAGVRQSLGLCPQHNILFDELTVKEHIYFYSRLKGIERGRVLQEIDKYVKLMELVPKADCRSSTLSGGMKRKLSVGVALCADSSVVILDEPTAGMDPSARRALWDLLKIQKKGRTILLSTHFMDEADLLGDRIAIMAGGKLECCGSSFFLKKKYGAGYHLIMNKQPNCDINSVTSLLRNYIPNIEVKSNIGSELTYALSEDHSAGFQQMLSELETRSTSLGITSYGISLTTLEEVFMKVGADHGQEESNNAKELNARQPFDSRIEATNEVVDGFEMLYAFPSNETVSTYSTEIDQKTYFLTGWHLWFNQIRAISMKRGLSIMRSWMLLLVQILIPVSYLSLTIIITGDSGTFNDPARMKITLDYYDDSVTLLTRNAMTQYSDTYIRLLENDNKDYINWKTEDMSEKLIDLTLQNSTNVRLRYIVGASFDKNNSIVAWFNNQPYHSAPLALQLVMNAILQQEVNSSNYSIQMSNHPMPYTLNSKFEKVMSGNNLGFQIAFNMGFSMAFVTSFYLFFYIKERASNAKHLQFVSGVEVGSFWIPAFILDYLTFLFICLCTVAGLAIFQKDGFKTFEELGRIFSVLVFFGFAILPISYLASYLFDTPATGFTRMTLITIFLGVAAFMVVQVLNTPDLDLKHVANIIHWIFLVVPHYALSSAVSSMNILYSTQRICNTAIEECVNLAQSYSVITVQGICKILVCRIESHCCDITSNYYDLKEPGIGRNLIFLSGVGVIGIILLLLVEYRTFEKIKNLLLSNYSYNPISIQDEDSDVAKEKERIRGLKAGEIIQANLVMRDVTKYYGNFLAVNSICLGVNKFECFGLLGVNGAGKTTTFKMMTGDIKFSSGEAWVNGQSLKTDMKRIHQLIGYCPQFDALLEDLTCRENLIIFSLLRGITNSESKFTAKKLAHQLDFYRHLDKKVKKLSGGNKRKLSTAIALIGDPLVIYLDEPTTGMDPATKRFLWNALCKVRDSGKCIILTSHSMEECEALCTRLAIMVNGDFKCLGSTQHLKNKFSEGYTLIIKVKKHGDCELDDYDLQPIKHFINQNFLRAVLREKHQELITYYIPDKTQSWSRMFGIMETAKQVLNIEDYLLGQCSLEQVFLTFTKQQKGN